MFSNVFKGDNPFTTTNTRLSMEVFCSSSNFLYVVILLKNEKMDLGVTTFWKHTHVWELLRTHSHTKLAKE
jgi:hypothetical protein